MWLYNCLWSLKDQSAKKVSYSGLHKQVIYYVEAKQKALLAVGFCMFFIFHLKNNFYIVCLLFLIV